MENCMTADTYFMIPFMLGSEQLFFWEVDGGYTVIARGRRMKELSGVIEIF
jgi:hypothetical protein